MGEPVLGRVAAGAPPFRPVPFTDPPRTSVAVAGPEVSVAPVMALPERVDEVLSPCAVVAVDAGWVVDEAGDPLSGDPLSGDPLFVEPPSDEPPSDDVSSVAQAAALTLLASKVTAPLRASSRPSTLALVLAVIEARAMTVPAKVEPTPSVDELPTCQKTLQAWAPLMRLTRLSVAVMRVEAAWKMKTASSTCLASSVNVPVMANDSGDL